MLQTLGDFLQTLGDFLQTLDDFLQTLGDFLQTLGDSTGTNYFVEMSNPSSYFESLLTG